MGRGRRKGGNKKTKRGGGKRSARELTRKKNGVLFKCSLDRPSYVISPSHSDPFFVK
jgi:hypothetical protein